MTTWIMIVFFGYRTAGLSVEFSSKEKCEAAATQVFEKIRFNDDTKFAVCVEK